MLPTTQILAILTLLIYFYMVNETHTWYPSDAGFNWMKLWVGFFPQFHCSDFCHSCMQLFHAPHTCFPGEPSLQCQRGCENTSIPCDHRVPCRSWEREGNLQEPGFCSRHKIRKPVLTNTEEMKGREKQRRKKEKTDTGKERIQNQLTLSSEMLCKIMTREASDVCVYEEIMCVSHSSN